MSTPLEAKRLTVKAVSAFLVRQDGEIRASRLDTRAADLLSCRRRGQDVLVATSGAIALGSRLPRHPLRLEENRAAAGQLIPPQAVSGIARREVAKRESIVRLEQCQTLDAGRVKAPTTALESASGRSIHVISGVASSGTAPILREGAALVRASRLREVAAEVLPA